MSTNCTPEVNIIQIQDNCAGKTIKTDCVVHPDAITYLEIPENSTVTQVIDNFVTSLADARIRVKSTEEDILNIQADVLALQESKIINTTTIPLTLAVLNATYPSASLGFKVHALSITSGATIYEKSGMNWIKYPVTIVT